MAELGRPKAIESPEQMQGIFEEYVEWVKENPIEIEDYVGKDADRVIRQKPRPLTLEGFECHCFANYGLVTLQQYFENREGRYADFVSICRAIRLAIRRNQIEGGMAGIFNPSITQRLNNLKEATDITSDNKAIGLNVSVLSDKDKDNLSQL